MKTKMNLANKNGYIFHDGKLQWFEFAEALVDFNRGQVLQTGRRRARTHNGRVPRGLRKRGAL